MWYSHTAMQKPIQPLGESTNTRAPAALDPFEPGDADRFVLPERWGGNLRPFEASPPETVCEVEVPSRLHASVVDMNRFDVGLPGGGGIGFGLALFCRARVVLRRGAGSEARGSRRDLALHVTELFRRMTRYDAAIEVELEDHGTRHLGLGSSIGALTAAATALNEIFGRPLALRDLRKLVAYNYCEELPGESRLVPGFETNVGAMVALHGGMVVASDRCELLCRTSLPESTRALILLPFLDPRPTSGEKEAAALLNRARELDRSDASEKAYRLVMDLLPAMISGDLPAVGEVLFHLTRLGSKRAECCLHGREGEEIYAAMDRLRTQGAEIVSMSSVGPAVFALSADPQVWKRWGEWDQPGAAASLLQLPVDNGGARVRLDGVPVPYRREPWWSEPSYRSGEEHA
ncbi:MAG: sugar kinase [Deltaproteobacteria bacterium]|nr:sugar kinase [Deltaproteobacteria bacterium]